MRDIVARACVSVYLSVDVCVHVHLLVIEVSFKTTGTHCVHVLFCMCMNAHLCLRTWIGCVAIETLTLF